jgi:hypothetical protein
MAGQISSIMSTLGYGGGNSQEQESRLVDRAKGVAMQNMSSPKTPMYEALKRMGFGDAELNAMSQEEVFDLYQKYIKNVANTGRG